MSAKERPPAFQFYPRDFLSSQKVSAMSLEQIGAHILLMCHAWLSDQPGTLPADPELLASLSRAGPRWPELAAGVLAGWQSNGHRLVQPRLREAREAQKRRLQQQLHGGWSRASGERDSKGRFVSTCSPPLPLQSASNCEAESSDSVPLTELSSPNGQVQTVRTRTLNGDPGPTFWNQPDIQAQIDRLTTGGTSLEDARLLVLSYARARERTGA